MHERKFSAPGDGKTDYAEVDEAASFFHVHEDTLAEWIDEHYPWVRRRRLGKKDYYHSADIAALNHIISLIGPPAKARPK